MSLETLARNLQAEAQGGKLSVSLASLQAAGLRARADLDTVIDNAFGWTAGTPLTLTGPLNVGKVSNGEAGAESLTVTGTLATLKVSGLATVQFTVKGSAVSFTSALPLGEWTFSKSFPVMTGFPFKELELKGPAFIFSSDGASVPYDGQSIAVTAGLNLASDLQFPPAFAALLSLLSSTPSQPLLMRGPLDPSVMVKDKLPNPDLTLSAPLVNGPLPKLAFLQLEDAEFVVEATTEETLSGKAQYNEVALSTKLDFGEEEPTLECRVSMRHEGGLLSLLLQPAEGAKQPTLDALFKAMGGRSWYDVVPAPLQSLFTAFELKGLRCAIAVVEGKPRLASVGMAIGTAQAYQPFEALTIGELDFGWEVQDPLGDPAVSAEFTGECKFLPELFPGVFYVTITSELEITAEYDGHATLSKLLSGGSAAAVQAQPLDFELQSVVVDFDVPRKAFSLSAAASASLDLFGGTLTLREINLGFARAVKQQSSADVDASLRAVAVIGEVPLFLDAKYRQGGWSFAGGLVPGASLPLGKLVEQLCKGLDLPTDFVPSGLEITPLELSMALPGGSKPATWAIHAGAHWTFSVGSLKNMEIDARLDLERGPQAGQEGQPAYSGEISGEAKLPLPFGTVDVVLAYEFKPNSKALLVEWKGFASATYSFTDETITFKLQVRSLGDMLAEIVRVVENEPDFQLPPPWDLLNQIVLKGFEVTWRLKPKQGQSTISLKYNMTGNEIKLFFVEIRAITISELEGKVMVGLDLKFITDSDFKEEQWPAQSPTPPPTGETSLFELDLLALGQHVSVAGLAQETDVASAVKLLESFKPSEGSNLPVKAEPQPGEPVYAPDSRWLVGTRFKVLTEKKEGKDLALLEIDAIFNDPQLYGLKILVGGAKAGVFGGLSFEILYRKVSETVGVYQIELTLPEWMRHLEFGEVSVTLPVVGVQIYTNGDFLIDFGFPKNMNFSRSFAIQAFPFTGAGGFYFGVLSNETATGLPQTTKGTFHPVIVFGIGLQIGLGKSIEEGIFTAQLTVSVFGIVEGIIAAWHPNPGMGRALPNGASAGRAIGGSRALAENGARALAGASQPIDDEYYYWLRGTIGIVGKLVGSVNFAIISATINVTVQAFVQLTIEAHRAIPVHLEAGVSVEITLKIDLGLFSIKIHLTFAVTVKADFQIGSASHAPWDPEGLAAAPGAGILEAPPALAALAPRAFKVLASEEKLPLSVYAGPHLTLADWTEGTPEAAYVVSLFLEGPIGRPAAKPPSDFEVLARETLLWVIANFGEQDPESLTPAQAAEAEVSAEQVKKALGHFTASGPPPLEYPQLRSFLSSRFTLAVKQPAAGEELPSAVALPMLPDLVLGVPAWGGHPERKIDFWHASACTPQYLEALQKRLSKLAVDLETPLQKQYAGAPSASRPGSPPTQSLASFVFEDMFALMCRHMLQAAADSFANFPYALSGKESLEQIAKAFPAANEVTAARLGQANAGLALRTGSLLSLRSVQHQVKAGESLNGIAAAYGAGTPLALAEANEGREGLLVEGVEIKVGAEKHTIAGRDTFASIAKDTGAQLAEVVAAIGPLTDVLQPLALLTIPTFTYKTAAKDTLSSVAGAFGVPIEALASANQGVESLFATETGKTTFVLVKALRTLNVEQLRETLHDANVYANLAGIATRFLLNGLRLPVGAGITLPPGSPCEGACECGLQALIGQQVTLPALKASESFTLTLSAGEEGSWIGFASGGSLGLPINNESTAGRTGQIDWINAVLGAAGAAIAPKTNSIAALADTRGVPRRFSLEAATPLQAAAPLAMPTGLASASPIALTLPEGMLAVLAQPAFLTAAFSLQLAEPARSGGGVTLRPAQSFGWATLISVTVKRPERGQTPMSPGIYELVGADPKGIVLLERLLQAAAQPLAFELLFAPNASAPASAGLQLENPATVSAFIVKANLSTATAPQGMLAARDARLAAGATPAPVTQSAASFAQLLWECSIVRSGGYSLYYESAPGSPGLPEHVFDSTGTAQLQVLLIHPAAEGLGAYVNAALLGDSIDSSHTSVLAQSEARKATIPAGAEASLEELAGGLHLTVSELAVQLAQQPLRQSASLEVSGGIYETRFGDTLEALAKRFGTTGAQIEAANAELKLDWSAIPAWTALRLPAASVTVGDTKTTLTSLAERFAVSVPALGTLNAKSPLLPQGQLAVEDEIVDSAAVLPPGIGGFEVVRTQLAGEPSEPSVYLDGTFHLLGYRLAENLGFKSGPSGLPVGPGEPLEEQQLQQLALDAPAPAEGGGGALLYEQLLPLAGNAQVNRLAPVKGPAPEAAANPYAGVGEIAQAQLEWRDLFGNRARTPLSEAKIEPSGAANLPPIPVQYTDPLLGAGQWPSVRVGYGVQAGSPPSLRIELAFDVSRYAGARSPGPAQQAALADRQTFARAYYQLGQVHADGSHHVSITVL